MSDSEASIKTQEGQGCSESFWVEEPEHAHLAQCGTSNSMKTESLWDSSSVSLYLSLLFSALCSKWVI